MDAFCKLLLHVLHFYDYLCVILLSLFVCMCAAGTGGRRTMYCCCHSVRLAAVKAGFSSADFVGDGDSERVQQKAMHAGKSGGAESSTCRRPTIDTYRTMSDDELEKLLRTREQQVLRLRVIYENFHYEVDKRFRTMVFDYHEKAMQLSQVHGKMQLGSLQISREALVKLREQQEMYTRDHRILLVICTVFTFMFWVWVRRHYVRREDLSRTGMQLRSSVNNRSVTGMDSYSENVFGSSKRSSRNVETSWEREVRERNQKTQHKEEEQQED